jgi:glycosyltransferase involved in cell wall biosynthesis
MQNRSADMRYGVAHQMWLRLPRGLRQRLFYSLTTMAAPRRAHAIAGGLPIGIAGLFSTASGLGEGARLAFAALDAAGLDPKAFDLSPAFDQSDLADRSSLRPFRTGQGGTIIIHINGPYIPYALWTLGRANVRGRRVIAYWAWELSSLPKSWRSGFQFVHEIWVPSQFTKDAIAAATDLPVRVVPHPLAVGTVTPLLRDRLDLPAEATVVLCIFNLGSTLSRKNPLATIAAFRRAYGTASDRVLVLKLVDPGTSSWARRSLEEAVAGACNIRVIDRVMSRHEITGLIAVSDIVISLHRSEGFGLVLAEAMHLGKPVIATGWSGNLEFMTEQNSALVSYSLVPARDPQGTYDMPNQEWAEPHIDHAADWIRRLGESSELRFRLGSAAAADISARLAPNVFVRRVSDLLHLPKSQA